MNCKIVLNKKQSNKIKKQGNMIHQGDRLDAVTSYPFHKHVKSFLKDKNISFKNYYVDKFDHTQLVRMKFELTFDDNIDCKKILNELAEHLNKELSISEISYFDNRMLLIWL